MRRHFTIESGSPFGPPLNGISGPDVVISFGPPVQPPPPPAPLKSLV